VKAALSTLKDNQKSELMHREIAQCVLCPAIAVIAIAAATDRDAPPAKRGPKKKGFGVIAIQYSGCYGLKMDPINVTSLVINNSNFETPASFFHLGGASL
jgi:hypothetical protein